MSIKVMSHVWEHSQHKGGDLLLLLAIADHADDHGVAFPSIGRLARKTRMTERNVQLVLKRLTHSQELTIQSGEGPRGCHLFQLLVPDACSCHGWGEKISPEKSSEVKKVRGEKLGRGGEIAISPEPSLDPSEDLKPKDPPIVPPEGGVSVTEKKVAMPRPKTKTGYPTDPDAQATLRALVFDAAFDAWVREKGLTLDLSMEWERFTSYSLAHGKAYADWRHAFMNWLTSPYQTPPANAVGTSKTMSKEAFIAEAAKWKGRI